MPKKFLLVVAAICLGVFSSTASAYSSFNVSVSAYALTYTGTIQATVFASYSDYSCTPTYQCDHNVFVRVSLHRGFGQFAPIVGQRVSQTGQYGSTVQATFAVPSCQLIPRFHSITYTVRAEAQAPDGEQRTGSTYVYVYSCRTT